MGTKKPPAKTASKQPKRRRQSPAELAPRVLEFLPGKQSDVAKALGRKASDGTVRRALQNLEEAGTIIRDDGVWKRCEELPVLAIPEDFDQFAVGLHGRTHEALLEQGTWRDHDVDLLNRYVRREQEGRQIRTHIEEHGRFQSGETRIYAHPGLDKLKDALRDVQALADALVITPDARRRHGRDGEEDAGDDFDL